MDKNKLERFCSICKVLSQPCYLRVLFELYKQEKTVTDLYTTLNLTPDVLCHQVRTLRDRNIISRVRRKGKFVYYAITDEFVNSIIGDILDNESYYNL